MDMRNDAYGEWRAGWDGRFSAHAMHLEWSLRFTAAQGHGLIAWPMSASRSQCIPWWSCIRDAMR